MPSAPIEITDRPLGQQTEEQKQQYNEQAYENFKDQGLVPCSVCSRTFLPGRIAVHERICEKSNSKKKALYS